MDDRQFEQLLQDKGLTAPRITPDLIQANIASEHYFIAEEAVKATEPDDHRYFCAAPALGLLTFCVLVLKNGFTVTGESACASPENFNAEAGRIAARRQAENKIWPLMGYELKSRLANEPQDYAGRLRAEKVQLDDRLTKLCSFICTSPAFQGLGERAQQLLREQRDLMSELQDVLAERCEALDAS